MCRQSASSAIFRRFSRGLIAPMKASVASRSAPASSARCAERWIVGPSVTEFGNGTASSSQSTPASSSASTTRSSTSKPGSPAFRKRMRPDMPAGRPASPARRRVERAAGLASRVPVRLDAAEHGHRGGVERDAVERRRRALAAQQRVELRHDVVGARRSPSAPGATGADVHARPSPRTVLGAKRPARRRRRRCVTSHEPATDRQRLVERQQRRIGDAGQLRVRAAPRPGTGRCGSRTRRACASRRGKTRLASSASSAG